MAAEPVENAGAGTASVDERRRAAPSRYLDRVDTQRGPAPVDMRVEVDQPGHDEQPAHIDGLGTAGGKIMPDFSYLSVAEGDVGRLVAPGRRVIMRPPVRIRSRILRASGKIGGGTRHDTRVREVRRGRRGCGSPFCSLATLRSRKTANYRPAGDVQRTSWRLRQSGTEISNPLPSPATSQERTEGAVAVI